MTWMEGLPMLAFEERKRRGAILRHLNDTPRYQAAAALSVSACRALGIPSTADQVETSLAWLAEQGLVTLEGYAHVTIGTLTKAGIEVATGDRVHPLIERPEPGI